MFWTEYNDTLKKKKKNFFFYFFSESYSVQNIYSEKTFNDRCDIIISF